MTLSFSTLTGGGGAQADNNFTVMTESNGYTLVDLTTIYPAGKYTVASKLLDTTYDIYLIAEDGSNAGYLAASSYIQLNITATQAFNKVVVYGATSNDVINFTYANIFSATGPSTGEYTGAAPRLISVSTSDLPNQNNTTTVTGQNFAADIEVTFTGSDNIARSAKAINRTSSTSMVVTRPDDMPTTYSPYTLTATNPGITAPGSTNAHKITNAITAGNAPVWVTAAVLPSYRKSEAYSQVIQATDADGGSAITYSIVSGTLPDGITFDTGTATFSGTPTTNAASPYSYTIRATDAGANYVDRAFTVQQLAPDAPTIGTATDVGSGRAYDNGAASVTFTPAATGPAATSYTVTAYLSGSATAFSTTGSSSPLTVSGLASNTSYTFLVKATNFSGDSLNSSQTSSTLITTVPQAPTIGTATTTGAQSASVPFTANATGGKTVTNYDITSSPLSLNYTGASSPISATSLPLGNNYTFTARAYNANGWSLYSSASNAVQMAYPASDSDNFNRSTSVALGSTTGNAQAWVADAGTWFANGSQAQTNDGYALAHVNINGTNQTVNADAYAQTGPAWWVSGAGSYWGVVPYYDTSITYSTACNQYIYDYSNSDPGGCCANLTYNRYSFIIYCGDGGSCYFTGTSSCGTTTQRNNCCSNSGGYAYCETQEGPYARCQVNSTTSTTNYNTNLRVLNNGSNYTSTNLTSNTSSYTNVGSLRVVTSSGSVAISAYSSAGQSSQLGSTLNFTPSTTQYQGVGIIKSGQGSVSGSTLDNWSASS